MWSQSGFLRRSSTLGLIRNANLRSESETHTEQLQIRRNMLLSFSHAAMESCINFIIEQHFLFEDAFKEKTQKENLM